MKTTDVDAWLKSGKYLPDVLRDFHDQKDVFKAIHQMLDVEAHDYCKDVSWISGQCYVIDIFLWWMARRGYTLQRTRKVGNFRDLAADVEAQNSAIDVAMTKALGLVTHNVDFSGAALADTAGK